MPKGGGRGYKGGHKGQRRHFTSPEELEAMKEKEEREKQWRKRRGDDDEEDGEDGENTNESGSESEEEGDEANNKEKGPVSMAEIENPNRILVKAKKISQLDIETTADVKTELSRKEREEVERQKARANYLRLHAEGKTDEAQADLARLAIIRKQREDAAKKREEDRKAKDAAKAAKTDSINKALGKGRKT